MSTSFAETRTASPSSFNNAEAGRQRAGHLWSSLADVCNLLQIVPGSAAADRDIVFQHVQFKAGQRIFTIGQPFDMLYIVNSGFLKTVLLDDAGNEQVLGFPMKGDLLGTDGIHQKKYASEAVALTRCDIVMVPFKILTALSRRYPELEMALYSAISRELVREQVMLNMLGSLSAEARVARFLISLSERFSAMGYSGKEFNLRMTRQDIGSYLGLTLETVSRTMSAFDRLGFITVDGRAVVLKEPQTLRTLRRLPPSKAKAKKVLVESDIELDVVAEKELAA